MCKKKSPLCIGIGGPVGVGKTVLIKELCKKMCNNYQLSVITNDIYTREDQRILIESGVLESNRIIGIETGSCPHTAIREDASMNFLAIEKLVNKFPDLDIIFIESGGDNLSATFSPELVDLSIYVIDVAAGDKIPRKGGPGITRSDFLVINKVDLALYVGASLKIMEMDTNRMRVSRPWGFANLKMGIGVDVVMTFLLKAGNFLE